MRFQNPIVGFIHDTCWRDTLLSCVEMPAEHRFNIVFHDLLISHVFVSAFIVKPVKHEHIKLPFVFVQFCSQPDVCSSHSSISATSVTSVRPNNETY